MGKLLAMDLRVYLMISYFGVTDYDYGHSTYDDSGCDSCSDDCLDRSAYLFTFHSIPSDIVIC
jgi:hypothetical protein